MHFPYNLIRNPGLGTSSSFLLHETRTIRRSILLMTSCVPRGLQHVATTASPPPHRRHSSPYTSLCLSKFLSSLPSQGKFAVLPSKPSKNFVQALTRYDLAERLLIPSWFTYCKIVPFGGVKFAHLLRTDPVIDAD